MTYYIYVLFSVNIDRYYIGYSSNPWNRLNQHLTNSAEKFTGKTNDWVIKAIFNVSSRESEAISLERFIKKQKSRVLIEKLCDPTFVPQGKLAQLVRVPHVRD